MRPAPTRVATYCSKVLVKVLRWRRSKFNTAMSCDTPESAALTTPDEMPAPCASCSMLPTKLWKSPPQRAARAGLAKVRVTKPNAQSAIVLREKCMGSVPEGGRDELGLFVARPSGLFELAGEPRKSARVETSPDSRIK